MIYQVESHNEGCPGYTWHISSNIELAYSVLTDPTAYDSCRCMTVISPGNGDEIASFYHAWNKKAPSLEEIKKELECYN